MVKRLAMEDPILPSLWHGLGEIYRSRLQDYEAAIVAFETAHQLDPGKNPERVKILGELYALAGHTASGGEDMVERAGKLVEADPTNPDAYRALGRACIDAGRLDEAWCVCRALVFLKQANPAEEELYRPPSGGRAAQGQGRARRGFVGAAARSRGGAGGQRHLRPGLGGAGRAARRIRRRASTSRRARSSRSRTARG